MTRESHIETRNEQLAALRTRARFFVSQRRKDVELYELLADCLAVCESLGDADEIEALKSEVVCRTNGRSYFENGADVFLVVGRYVFGTEKARAATWRYTATLREAHNRGIKSGDLVEFLRASGGINRLFKERPVEARTTKTKTLNLNSAITVPKDQVFSVRLERDTRGFFNVLEVVA